MRYVEFKHAIAKALRQSPEGLTWAQLRQRLDLPYERACPTWIKQMEQEIGLSRMKGSGRAYIWTLKEPGK